MKKDKVVDYLAVVARAAEEDRARQNADGVLPEPAGEQVVDYLAVSDAWKEKCGWMNNDRDK